MFTSRIRAALSFKLGRCRRCTRSAFVATVLTWTLVIVAAQFGLDGFALALAVAPALGFSLLLLTHLTTFLVRLARVMREADATSADVAASGVSDERDRREFLFDFLKVGAAGIVALVLGGRTPARAQGIMDCGEHVLIEFNAAGDPVDLHDCSEGICPDALCRRDHRPTPHGGHREWCDCEKDKKESERSCHVVLVKLGPGEGGPKKILRCAGSDCSHAGETCLREPELHRKVAVLPNGNTVWRVRCCKPT